MFSLRLHADGGLVTLDYQRPQIGNIPPGLHRTLGVILRSDDFDFGQETRLEVVRVLRGCIEMAGKKHNPGNEWTVTPGTPLVFSAPRFTVYKSHYPRT